MFQVKKLQDRVSKAKEEVSRGREKYELGLREISEYNPKYIEVSLLIYFFFLSKVIYTFVYKSTHTEHPQWVPDVIQLYGTM